MKFIAIAAAALLLVSCGGKKDNKPGTPSGAGSGEAVNLKLNVKPGDNFDQKMVMNMNMHTEATGQKVDMKMGFDAAMNFAVMAADTTGGAKLKMTYTSADGSMDMGAAGGAMGDKINDLMSKAMKAMTGESLVMNIDKSGKPSDPLNYEEFKERLIKKFDSLGLPSGSGEKMTESLGKKNLANNMQMMFNIYPDKPVKPGDSWTTETIQDMNNISMKIKNEYTLDKVEGGTAYITVKGTAASDGVETEGGGKLMDMKINQSGDMEMNVGMGTIKKMKMKMEMEATVEAMGTKMPMKMDAKFAIN